MLALALAVVLTRSWDWAAAGAELELLRSFAPVAVDLPKAPFVKLGGTCYQPGPDGKVKLGEGSADGHVWHWSLEVKVAKGLVTLQGPSVKHGMDRKGDARTFNDKGPLRKLAAGPMVKDVWPLYAEAHHLELLCFGSDESTATCGGRKKTCKKCSTLRLTGGPRGGQHVYGDGVVRANLNETCENLCSGPGLDWPDFEAFAALVKRTPVVDLETSPLAQVFGTREACEAATFDLDPAFKPVEPEVPARKR